MPWYLVVSPAFVESLRVGIDQHRCLRLGVDGDIVGSENILDLVEHRQHPALARKDEIQAGLVQMHVPLGLE